MNYLEKIEERKSIREFKKRNLSEEVIKELKNYYDTEIQRLIPDIETEFLVFTDDAKSRLEGNAGYLGKSFGAPAYLIILSEPKDHYLMNAGYMGEDLCLKMTEMDIAHCWLTFDDSEDIKRALLIKSDKAVGAIIACGYSKQEILGKRIDILTPSLAIFKERKGHVAPKIAQEALVYSDYWGNPVNWDDYSVDPTLDKAFYAASLAPSFLNKQPYRYILQGSRVVLVSHKEDMTNEIDTQLNLGTTMLNFSVIASTQFDSDWEVHKPSDTRKMKLPKDYQAVAEYVLK